MNKKKKKAQSRGSTRGISRFIFFWGIHHFHQSQKVVNKKLEKGGEKIKNKGEGNTYVHERKQNPNRGKGLCNFPGFPNPNSIYRVVVLRSRRESICKKKRVKAGVVFSPGKRKEKRVGGCGLCRAGVERMEHFAVHERPRE